jgi:hypothetical protein
MQGNFGRKKKQQLYQQETAHKDFGRFFALFFKIKKGHSARNRVPFFGVGVLKKKSENLFKDGSILDDGVAVFTDRPSRRRLTAQCSNSHRHFFQCCQ